MQFQIECNSAPLQTQICLICVRRFEPTEAKVAICDDQGKPCGEVCPVCLQKGYGWLNERFNRLNQAKKPVSIQRVRNLDLPIGA